MKFNITETAILSKHKFLLKEKTKGIQNASGRNREGSITVNHKGGGNKKKFRKINFNRTNISAGIICAIEYDPFRGSKIAAVYNFSGKIFFYILAPKRLQIGDIVKSGSTITAELGNSLPIAKIPVGSFIHNICINILKPAQICRAAGAFSRLKEKTLFYAIIQLNSGKLKLISPKCYASIGIVSNELAFLLKLKKAGQSRWLNKRPTVRGVAMNPVDHKNGGGEGKKSNKKKIFWGKTIKKNHK